LDNVLPDIWKHRFKITPMTSTRVAAFIMRWKPNFHTVPFNIQQQQSPIVATIINFGFSQLIVSYVFSHWLCFVAYKNNICNLCFCYRMKVIYRIVLLNVFEKPSSKCIVSYTLWWSAFKMYENFLLCFASFIKCLE